MAPTPAVLQAAPPSAKTTPLGGVNDTAPCAAERGVPRAIPAAPTSPGRKRKAREVDLDSPPAKRRVPPSPPSSPLTPLPSSEASDLSSLSDCESAGDRSDLDGNEDEDEDGSEYEYDDEYEYASTDEDDDDGESIDYDAAPDAQVQIAGESHDDASPMCAALAAHLRAGPEAASLAQQAEERRRELRALQRETRRELCKQMVYLSRTVVVVVHVV